MLWIITFDEHGGFPDHVPPPSCPNPDNKIATNGFNFDRLGVRVPTLLVNNLLHIYQHIYLTFQKVSPWVKKGKVVHQGKKSEGEFEHSSIASTLFKIFGEKDQAPPPLNKRGAWAQTFEELFTELNTPRKTCIKKLPDAVLPKDDEKVKKEDEKYEAEDEWYDAHSEFQDKLEKRHLVEEEGRLMLSLIRGLMEGKTEAEKKEFLGH